jgi:hypothetical protein
MTLPDDSEGPLYVARLIIGSLVLFSMGMILFIMTCARLADLTDLADLADLTDVVGGMRVRKKDHRGRKVIQGRRGEIGVIYR